jgi:hypothetical protein
MTMQNNEFTFKAPRSFFVFFIQYMAIIPFCTAFGFSLLPLLSMPSNSSDIVILLLLIVLLLIIGFALLYFPQKHRTLCVYDKTKNVLKKIKGKNILTYDLDGITKILLIIIKKNIGVNIIISLVKNNNTIELYSAHNYLSYTQWVMFANKLAKATSLPLMEVDRARTRG